MAATTNQLGDLTAAALRTVTLFGDRPGVVSVGIAHCTGGGDPHVAIGTDSLATLGRFVSDLAQIAPVRHLVDAPTPAWMGEASGVQLCVFVDQPEDRF
jgi:hypothetical protein